MPLFPDHDSPTFANKIPWYWPYISNFKIAKRILRLGIEIQFTATILFFRKKAAEAGAIEGGETLRKLFDKWADLFTEMQKESEKRGAANGC